MDDAKQRVLIGAYLTVGGALSSLGLTLALGGSVTTFGKLWVLTSANLFGVVLFFVPGFEFPMWVWYMVVLFWIGLAHTSIKYLPD